MEVVGREKSRDQVRRDEDGRAVERPAAEQHIHGAALQRAITRGFRNAAPEQLERLARAWRASRNITADERRRVHRTRRSAGDALDFQPLFFEKTVQHAPSEGAMRSTALQGEVDRDRLAHHSLSFISRHRPDAEDATGGKQIRGNVQSRLVNIPDVTPAQRIGTAAFLPLDKRGWRRRIQGCTGQRAPPLAPRASLRA